MAMLRILAELKQELGIVLSVAHFHHGIRGEEADADLEFVRELAEHLGLELHLGAADTPAHARAHRLSLETAARELRHRWFVQLIDEKKADKIATAHTLDDQAETVLMRLVRGAGVRGLAGIFPRQKAKHLIRPLLAITRGEIESYLKKLSQPWREDSSNQDVAHTRNRIRHRLLPLLEHEFNPDIRGTLADVAEVARAESEYWDTQTAAALPRILRQGKPTRSGRSASGEASRLVAVDVAALAGLHLSLQRRALQRIVEQLGSRLEFSHIEQLLELAREGRSGKKLLLPGGLIAIRTFRELQFTATREDLSCADYRYSLSIPGQIVVPEIESIIRTKIVKLAEQASASLLNPSLLGGELIVRNWRAGDKFFPPNTSAPKKLKELLQPGRMTREMSPRERKAWPVAESNGQLVWVRGFPAPQAFAAGAGDAVLIEEIPLEDEVSE